MGLKTNVYRKLPHKIQHFSHIHIDLSINWNNNKKLERPIAQKM